MSQALYRWFDKNGYLLYVGISRSIHHRVKQHQKTAEWITKATFMTVDWKFDTREEVERAERQAIRSENPLYNKAHSIESNQVIQITPPGKVSQEANLRALLDSALKRMEMYKMQYDREALLETRYKEQIEREREYTDFLINKPIQRIFVA